MNIFLLNTIINPNIIEISLTEVVRKFLQNIVNILLQRTESISLNQMKEHNIHKRLKL